MRAGLSSGADHIRDEAHHELPEALHGALLAQGLSKSHGAAGVGGLMLAQALGLRPPLDPVWTEAGVLEPLGHSPGRAAAARAAKQWGPV